MDGFDYTFTGEDRHVIDVARVLANGVVTKEPAPDQDPVLVLYFTVSNTVYGVKVWNNYFTYNGYTYQLQDVGLQARGTLTAN